MLERALAIKPDDLDTKVARALMDGAQAFAQCVFFVLYCYRRW
jgi:hypothetical protein